MASKKNATKTKDSSFSQKIHKYFHAHWVAFKMGFHHLAKAPLTTLTTIVAIGVCLALPMSLYLMVKNVQQLSRHWDQHSSMTLYIDPKTPVQEIHGLIQKAKQFPCVKKCTYTNPDMALREFQEASQLGDILSLLNDNPLPGVLSIDLNAKNTLPEDLQEMRATLEKMPHVQSASFDYDWVEKLNTILAFGKALSHFLYALIGFGVMFIVGNTIRLALERHRDEIEVLNLVGATQTFIRRPFLYRGILFGGLAGVIAILILNLALLLLKNPTEEIVSLYQDLFRLQYLSFYDTLLFLGASALLGWGGAAFAFVQQQRAFASES